MNALRQICTVAGYNFHQWRRNPRIVLTFALAFVLCFLLSAKVMAFTDRHGTTMQLLEPFIWTFGDSNSILLSSLLLVFLFADMPFISAGTPLYLMRTTRRIWLAGQVVYILLTTCLYLAFVLCSTVLLCVRCSFVGDLWSETAAMLGYSQAGEVLSVPAIVKTMEMSSPLECAGTVFGLMLLYALLLAVLMLASNLFGGQRSGMAAAFGFSLYGFLLSPETFKTVLHLSDRELYKANVLVGWLSPLNQATYQMHSFGYDQLPRLWQSRAIFTLLIILCLFAAFVAVKRYNFAFTGTEGET